jgi:hypothetical protein
VAELWTGEDDFIVLEEDVLPTEELIREISACSEPWCSGTYGRWYWALLCARTDGEKPCREPPGRCGKSDMSPEKAARIAACPLRLAGQKVLISDSWLACVKFGSIRRLIPELLVRRQRIFRAASGGPWTAPSFASCMTRSCFRLTFTSRPWSTSKWQGRTTTTPGTRSRTHATSRT